MPSHIEQLSKLETRLMDYRRKSQENDNHDAGFVALLKRIVDVVRDADSNSTADLTDIVKKAGSILDEAVDWAYGDGEFDFLQSFAHSANAIVKDSASQPVGQGMANSFMELLQRIGQGPIPRDIRNKLITSPWTASYRPHPTSTRLSRFRDGVNTSAIDATPIAKVVLQARCEVSSDDFPCPVNAAVAADSSALAVVGQGGWKHRDPVLSLYILDETEDSDEDEGGQSSRRSSMLGRHYRSVALDPGLSEVAYQVAMDTPHKLAFIADSYRIKSFYWGRKGEGAFKDWAPQTNHHDGPIAMLSGGRLARVGKESFAIWEINKLATHKGGKGVGKGKFDVESWRDNDNDEIEWSTGSKPTSIIKLADEDTAFAPVTIALHEPSGHILAGENARKTTGRYGCYALDLQDGGKKVARYLGHGGSVEGFSISAGDTNIFATGCSDGYARLYDVRHPTPIITLDSGKSGEFCSTVQLIHPDGIPVVFTGGDRSQSIKTWDIRARTMVYELATGNNAPPSATTWIATGIIMTTGMHASWAQLEPQEASSDEDEDMDDEEYDSDDSDGEENWPENAYHTEDSFGYAYDAGEHTLLRYGFKENTDTKELPVYGQATVEREGGHW